MTKLLDWYFKRAILWDVILIGMLVAVRHKYLMAIPIFTCPKIDNLLSNISDLISVSISLAGFVLASLTIIVTFKENSKLGNENPTEGINLLFGGKHYKQIVKVFAWSSFILLLIFIFLSIIKLIHHQFSGQVLLDIVIVGIYFVSTTTLRSLLVLYSIIKLQIK